MSQVLANLTKIHASANGQQMAQPRWGLVTGYDPDTGNVKVLIQPEGVQSGWLPVLYPCVGNGWGMVSPPPHNAMVKLIHENGDGDFPVVIGCSYNKQDVPPKTLAAFGGQATSVLQGEHALVSQTGAVIRLCADNTIYVSGASLQVDCPLFVNGPIHAAGDVVAGHVSLQGHKHGGVQQGSQSTAIPNGSP